MQFNKLACGLFVKGISAKHKMFQTKRIQLIFLQNNNGLWDAWISPFMTYVK
jgi:hypothetical protein